MKTFPNQAILASQTLHFMGYFFSLCYLIWLKQILFAYPTITEAISIMMHITTARFFHDLLKLVTCSACCLY